MTISAKQIQVIHVAKAKLGLEDDDYHAILRDIGGVQSAKDLTDRAFEAVMFRLAELGFKSDWNRRNFGYRADMATPRQVALIRHLWSTFTDGRGTDETLGKWLENKFKVSSIRFVPADRTSKAIGALQTMVKQKSPAKARA